MTDETYVIYWTGIDSIDREDELTFASRQDVFDFMRELEGRGAHGIEAVSPSGLCHTVDSDALEI